MYKLINYITIGLVIEAGLWLVACNCYCCYDYLR